MAILMTKKRFLIYLILSTLLIVFAILFTARLDDFSLEKTQTVDIKFKVNNNLLSGTLILPPSGRPNAITLFIHGDGPQDRYSNGGYMPLINTLVANNIGVFSWDKAGIGESEGNWLTQSMNERATEAQVALNLLREKYPTTQIGYFGFSQAGWVIPIAASNSSPDFSVIIGGAVNWRDQGAFYHRTRLNRAGLSPKAINQLVDEQLQSNDHTFGINGNHDPATSPEMSTDRFNFVVKNYLNDASKDIPQMNGRILAIWGEDDLNVDARTDACRYKKLLAKKPDSTVILIKNSTHGLLNASWFNYQLESQWPWWKKAYFLYLGRDGYNPEALNFLINWLNDQQTAIPTDWQPHCNK